MHETMSGKAPVILGGHEHEVFEEVGQSFFDPGAAPFPAFVFWGFDTRMSYAMSDMAEM